LHYFRQFRRVSEKNVHIRASLSVRITLILQLSNYFADLVWAIFVS
jgi:hypothetical protein